MTSPRHRPHTLPPAPPEAASPDENREQGSLVVVQERVLGDIAHELGNFFHKLYYWSDFIKSDGDGVKKADSTVGHMLERTIANLEEFLKVALEYFHPISLNFTKVPVGELLDGFVANLRALANGTAVDVVREDLDATASMLVDLNRISQVFRIALQQALDEAKSGGTLRTYLGGATRGERAGIEIALEIEPKTASSSLFRGAEAGVEWAVAQKLIELHGGEITQQHEANGRKVVRIFLPLYV